MLPSPASSRATLRGRETGARDRQKLWSSGSFALRAPTTRNCRKSKRVPGNGPDLARRDQVGIHGQILPCIDPKAMRAHILCPVQIEITVRGEVEQGWHVGFAIELDPQAQVTDKGIATRDPYRSRISLVAMRTVKGKQNAVRIRRLNGPGTIGEAIRPAVQVMEARLVGNQTMLAAVQGKTAAGNAIGATPTIAPK